MTDDLEFVTITPEWVPLCEWFARSLAEHGFEKGAYGPVASFIDIVRYLALTDPQTVRDIICRLESK